MTMHHDVELQILEHLRALREELAVIRVKVQNVEDRLDLMACAEPKREGDDAS